ncbi:UDP-glucuronic acid decarboxylase 1 [Mortierella alpina]|nr:UDP-glucuronic acid decarboxylase 1 [Mortierella alpina]
MEELMGPEGQRFQESIVHSATTSLETPMQSPADDDALRIGASRNETQPPTEPAGVAELAPEITSEGSSSPLVRTVGDKAVRSDIPLAMLQQLYLPDKTNAYRQINVQDKTLSFPHAPTFPPVKMLPNQERKRILVTGGAGFVGSHLVDRLMLMGHEVIVLDNFFTGSKRNVQHWLGHPHFELIRHDVVDPFMIEVDQIYHLACPASPPHYQYNPIKTVKTSVMGTINMLGLAKRTKARFLLTSTSEVYGDPEEHPQKETYWGHVNPIGPRACYDEGKRVAETLTYSYMHQDEVDVRVARIFNTFGPRMNENDGRVVSNFIMQALRGDELTIYGDGQQTRSFQYVHDLVDGLILLMNKNYTEPVNLGNPEEYTIREFAEMIRKEINSSVEIMSLPPTEDDPQRRRPDIGRAQRYLGWAPKFSVDQGIRETVQYFKNTKSEQSCFMATTLRTPHPYYPQDLVLNHYVGNTYTVPQILACVSIAFSAVAALAAALAYQQRHSTLKDRRAQWTFFWFFLCGMIHTVFEGYFGLHHVTIAGETSLLAQVWKEYALSDSRYMTSNTLVLIMERITIIYSCTLYYLTSLVEGSPHCDPHPYYVYFYFVFFNSFWMIAPVLLLKESITTLTNAVKKHEEQLSKKSYQ